MVLSYHSLLLYLAEVFTKQSLSLQFMFTGRDALECSAHAAVSPLELCIPVAVIIWQAWNSLYATVRNRLTPSNESLRHSFL